MIVAIGAASATTTMANRMRGRGRDGASIIAAATASKF
jgi:hypothetical protein